MGVSERICRIDLVRANPDLIRVRVGGVFSGMPGKIRTIPTKSGRHSWKLAAVRTNPDKSKEI